MHVTTNAVYAVFPRTNCEGSILLEVWNVGVGVGQVVCAFTCDLLQVYSASWSRNSLGAGDSSVDVVLPSLKPSFGLSVHAVTVTR
jgi:hypothetical protein